MRKIVKWILDLNYFLYLNVELLVHSNENLYTRELALCAHCEVIKVKLQNLDHIENFFVVTGNYPG